MIEWRFTKVRPSRRVILRPRPSSSSSIPDPQINCKAQGRKTDCYIFNGADVAELMKALDPEWPGAIPHTVLVAPNGEILWRHNGPIDGDELRSKIFDYLGPFVGSR